ncbi:MAG: linear amide C-N hydrolase, partial [bacterium]|nr:linear amide C-N hydrolase [bacterium]
MRTIKFMLIVLVIIPFFSSYYSWACTTFCFQENGQWIYGRNYDWQTGHCLLIVNKKGIAKRAFTGKNPAQWVSKYGSVTFNQYGREFPLGGMNEAGLVIECMWLAAAEYPRTDTRAQLSELQWIQYQLDNCSSVEEVITSDKQIRVDAEDSALLHFLVCDSRGGAAAIEFLGGKMKAYTRRDLPVSALANSTYQRSVQFLETINGNEESRAFKWANYSLKRFVWASLGVKRWHPGISGSGTAVDYAFKILDRVSVARTMFRVVYDVKHKRIYYRTKRDAAIRFVNLSQFNFSRNTPVKILDLSKGGKGDVTASFSDYTFKANYDLLKKSFRET